MKKDMDKIIFERRSEIGDVLNMITRYVQEHPQEQNNATLRRLYDLLDVMEMEW